MSTDDIEIKPIVRDLEGFKAKPFRKLEMRLRILEEETKRKQFTYKVAWERDVTNVLFDALEFAVRYKNNIIVVLQAIPGTGKSTIGHSLAIVIQKLFKDIYDINIKIHLTFSNDETVRVAKKLNYGDVIFQDEESRQIGEDSITMKKAIHNLEEQIRANQNSFIYCSPTSKGHVCDVIIEPYAIDYKQNRNLAFVKEPTEKKVLGLIMLPLINDPELEKYYSERKKSHVKSTIEWGGISVTEAEKKQVDDHVAYLMSEVDKELEKVFGDKESIDWKIITKDLLKTIARMAHIKGSRGYVNHIVNKGWLKVQLKKLKARALEKSVHNIEVVDSDSVSVSDEEHFSYHLDSKSEDEGILHLIYQKMREIFPKINKSRLKEKHLEAWYDYYVLAKPARKLLSKYNIKTSSNFENKYEDWGWIAIVEQEILGYAAELAVNEKYFPSYRHQGQKAKADLINDDKHWIEIKTRSENKLPKWDDFSREEKILLKQGYPGLYIMLFHSRGKPMKIHRYIIENDVIHKSDNKDGVRDIFISTKRETIEEEMKENMDPNYEDFWPVSTYPVDITEGVSRLYLTVGQEKVASFIIEGKGEREWRGMRKKSLLLKKGSVRREEGNIKKKPARSGGYRYI